MCSAVTSCFCRFATRFSFLGSRAVETVCASDCSTALCSRGTFLFSSAPSARRAGMRVDLFVADLEILVGCARNYFHFFLFALRRSDAKSPWRSIAMNFQFKNTRLMQLDLFAGGVTDK